MNLRVTFDRTANAAYIYLREIDEGGIAHTVICDDLPAHLDLDKSGRVIGIEVFEATQSLSIELIHRAERI